MQVIIKPVKQSSLMIVLFLLNTQVFAQQQLDVARYNASDQLIFPADTDTWIHLGSSLGSEYGDEPFDPANPGTIGVVQMEPSAYRYFTENGQYADGTMFLLSFYDSEAESDPQLPGFVQGALSAKEIHVIDSARFSEGRGFFLYQAQASSTTPSTKVPDNSTCVVCHMAEGRYNGTFTQFYPTIRDIVTQ